MSIADILGSSFSSTTRNRGRDYFYSGKVRICESTRQQVTAEVSGSRRSPYSVEIDWSGAPDGEVVATCTCPHYEDGFLCKHIWATLLKIDHEEPADAMPLRGATIVHEYDDEFESDYDDWHDEPLEEAELEVFDTYRDRLDHTAVGPRRRSSGSIWQAWLRQVFDYVTRLARRKPIAPMSPQKRREAWFVFNVGESLRSGQVVIDFRQRETRQDGDFGKIKKLSVRRDAMPEFTDAEDGRLIELLIGNQSADESPYASYSYHAYRSFSRAVIAPAMYDVLLPSISATGRFVWQLDSSLPAEEGSPIAWDSGDPWRFRLRAEEDDRRRVWQLSGQVCCGRDVVPLGDVVLLMASGIILFPDKLARLDVSADQFGWIVILRAQGAIEVPYSDRDQLLETLYRLPELPEMELPAALRVRQLQEKPRGRMDIKSPRTRTYHSRNRLYANVGFVYGDRKFDLHDQSGGQFDSARNCALLRNRQQEAELLEQLSGLGLRPTADSSFHYREFDLCFHQSRLPEIVHTLTKEDWIVESEGVRIRQPGAFNISVTSGVDWFQLDAQIDFDGMTPSLPDLLKALRNKEKYIRLDDGSQGMLPEEWLQKYGHLAEMAEGEGDTLRFAPSQALLLHALLAEQENVRVDRQFAAFRKKLQSFDGVKASAEPRGFRGKLRKYQKEGLGWLHFLREFRLGGCLADDMGLGKTIQVLALLQSRRLGRPKKGEDRRPSIVVVPKSLVFNWIDEAARFTPHLRTLDYTGRDRKSRLEDSDGFDLLVTTYGTLRRDVVTLKEMHFDYAILDESQAVKNHSSQAAKASRLLQADHRLALTGTPIENHLGEAGTIAGRSFWEGHSSPADARSAPDRPEPLARCARGGRGQTCLGTRDRDPTEYPGPHGSRAGLGGRGPHPIG